MTIYLKGYSFGNRMVIVARDEAVCCELLNLQMDIMYIHDNQIIYLPNEEVQSLDGMDIKKIDLLCNYDIVEISDTGILYRSFANNEADSTVFLGARCNSNCIMCPAGDAERKKGFSYTREQLMKYIDYLPGNLEHLVITGGEPTMQRNLFIEALKKIKVKFSYTQVLLLTNGRSLSDRELFERMVEAKPNRFRIAIPIHGSNAAIHDSITRSNGSFEQTLLGLRRVISTDIKIEIRIVVIKKNCNDLLNIAKLISECYPNVHCVNFLGLEPRGNCALNFDDVYIEHKSSFEKSKPAIDHLIHNGIDVGLYNYPLCAVDKGYWSLAAKSISHYKNVYHPDCDLCDVREICGGFFTAAMRIAHPEVHPIKC